MPSARESPTRARASRAVAFGHRLRDVARQIEEARGLEPRARELVSRMPALAAALEAYGRAIEETGRDMDTLGVIAACSACAKDAPGGCCFRGMGESVGAVLLVVNLLLGKEVVALDVPLECCQFVGPRGCTLAARPTYCASYFCPELAKTLGPDRMARHQAVIGNEALAGFEVERLLASALRGGL